MVAAELNEDLEKLKSKQKEIEDVFLHCLLSAIDGPEYSQPVESSSMMTTEEISSKTASPKKPAKKRTVKSSKGTKKEEDPLKRWKNYVFRCGVRKQWKKELEGMKTTAAAQRHIEGILRDLGMQGRPTLEKCKQIKDRREFEQELAAVDTSNIVRGRLRSRQNDNAALANEVSDSESENADGSDVDSDVDGDEHSGKRIRLNLLALGDSEEE